MKIWREIRKTAFFVTHRVEEALYLSKRVLRMLKRNGRNITDFVSPFSRNIKSLQEFIELRENVLRYIRR